MLHFVIQLSRILLCGLLAHVFLRVAPLVEQVRRGLRLYWVELLDVHDPITGGLLSVCAVTNGRVLLYQTLAESFHLSFDVVALFR